VQLLNRDEKASKVSELNETFGKAKFAVVTDYRGLKVTELEKLRRELKKNEGQIRVAKNTLLKLAVQGTEYEALSEFFTGTTAVAVSFADPVASAKALTGFAKEYNALSIRSAVLEGKTLSAEDVVALSKLPGKPELQAKLLGTLAAVPTGLVRVLNGVPSKFVYVLQAIKEQKEN
jgi:large subunit ribosomal protein L10